LLKFGKEAVNLASDLQEVQNVVDTVFGDMASKVNEFSKNAIESFGLSELSAKQYASTLGAMLKPTGLASAQITEMSINLTKASGGMASFFNKSAEVINQDIQSYFAGSSETMLKYGLIANIANMQSYALSQGINKTWQEMTQAEQQMLRYNYLVENLGYTFNDFEKTQNSFANQQRILTERWKEFLTLIQTLTPAIKLLNMLLSAVLRVTRAWIAFYSAITGQKISSEISNATTQQSALNEQINSGTKATNGSIKATKKAAKENKKASEEAKKSLASFDEVTVIKEKEMEDAGLTSSGGDTGGGLGGLEAGGGAGGLGIEELSDQTSDFEISDDFEKVPEVIQRIKDIDIQPLVDSFYRLREALEPFGELIKSGIGTFIDDVLFPLVNFTITDLLPSFLDTIASSLDLLYTTYTIAKPLLDEFWVFLLRIGSWTGGAIVNALDRIKGALDSVNETFKQNPDTVRSVMEVLGVLSLTIVGIIATIKTFSAVTVIATNLVGVLGGAIAFITSPIGLTIVAITALITALTLLYRNNESFRKKVQEIWGKIKTIATETFGKVREKLEEIWTKTIKPTVIPALEKLMGSGKRVFGAIGGFMKSLWDNVISPVLLPAFTKIKDTVLEVLPKVYDNFAEIFADISEVLTDYWDNYLIPVIDYIADEILPVVKPIFTEVGKIFGDVFESAISLVGNLTETLKGIVSFIINVFTGDWSAAWEDVKTIFSGVFKSLVNIARVPINSIIRMINKLFEKLSSIKISIPSVDIPGIGTIGGGSVGFPKIPSIPEIPALATGAVIPPNSEFLALLGDQKSGVNIETPLETMIEAFETALNNNGRDININFKGSVGQVVRMLKPEIEKENRRVGRKKSM
jgi:hypothetical protein